VRTSFLPGLALWSLFPRPQSHGPTFWTVFYGKRLVNVRALPDARSRSAVNGEAEFRARPVKPFGGGRPWLRRTRTLCKFNDGEKRSRGPRRLCCRLQNTTRRANELVTATKDLEKRG
jgi:hypothetical protein